MHEAFIARRIVDAIERIAEEKGAERVLAVRLIIGQLRLLNLDVLRHAFEIFAQGTKAEGAKLEVEVVPAELRCARCGHRWRLDPSELGQEALTIAHMYPDVVARLLTCPACGSGDVEILCGEELAIGEVTLKLPADEALKSKPG